MSVKDTLDERGKTYGIYTNVAGTSQSLKDVLCCGAAYDTMEPAMKESLDMICNKIARIVNGNPYYRDSWHDIMGYAALVDTLLEEMQK